MQLQFVLDYRSIYSYLANSQVDTIGAPVDYKVVDIVKIMKTVNNQPSPMCPPKLKYSLMDASRWATAYRLPLAANQPLLRAMKEGEVDASLLSRAAIAAQQLNEFQQVNAALFKAVWAGSDDLITARGRAAFLKVNDLPPSLWEIAQTPEVIDALTANNAQAVSNGVFGVPTFFVGQEMFFGNDRLDLVRAHLASLTSDVL